MNSIDSALQSAIDGSIKNSGAVGVSAAVIFPDGQMWKGASRISHEGVPITADMLFDIASIQKNFQAALALKLVEDGVMSLDDTLGKWFPPYPNIHGRITIRQILNLTSGIHDFVGERNSPFRIGYVNIRHEKMWTWQEIYDTFVREPDLEPGTRCAYSSTNYIVLRHVIEKATRRKQTALFEDRLLQPLELSHTLADFSKPVPNNVHIVHVPFFRRLCEVERPGDNRVIVDSHNLVVRYCMGIVEENWNAGLYQHVGGSVSLCLLTLVEHDLHADSALVRSHKSLRNRL